MRFGTVVSGQIGEPDAVAGPTSCDSCLSTSCAAEQKACDEDATCPALKLCLDECATSACRSACFVTYPDPGAKAKNGALFKCQCVIGCADACTLECK